MIRRPPRSTLFPYTTLSDLPELGLTPAQAKAETDYTRIRLREEMTTAAYGAEAGARTLLDSDPQLLRALEAFPDRKSTRLNSSHTVISYAVFCLKKKKKQIK